MHDGCKCHIKFYSLLLNDDSRCWDLYTYKNAFLSISPNQWSPNDVSSETQITVKRDVRLELTGDEWKNHVGASSSSSSSSWPAVYAQCQTAVADIINNAIQQGKLQPRLNNQRQFEVFSADFMLDTFGKLWIIEFNFTPVLYDPSFAMQEEGTLTTAGLKRYHALYLKNGDEVQVNDSDMIRDAVTIAFYDSQGLPASTKWDKVVKFDGGD